MHPLLNTSAKIVSWQSWWRNLKKKSHNLSNNHDVEKTILSLLTLKQNRKKKANFTLPLKTCQLRKSLSQTHSGGPTPSSSLGQTGGGRSARQGCRHSSPPWNTACGFPPVCTAGPKKPSTSKNTSRFFLCSLQILESQHVHEVRNFLYHQLDWPDRQTWWLLILFKAKLPCFPSAR